MKEGKKFSAPVRVYWDLADGPEGGLGASKSIAVACELAGSKVFFAALRLASGPMPGLGDIISALKGGGARVTVSVCDPGSFPSKDVIARADVLDLCPKDAAGLSGLLKVAEMEEAGREKISVSVVPTSDGGRQVEEIFGMAANSGIRLFSLPNPDLVNLGGPASRFVLDEGQRALCKKAVEGVLRPLGETARLFVHDLFLHKALDLPGLAGHIEYAGCQAGDAIAYIDKTGLVYPCRSMPFSVGDLKHASFRDIWSGEERNAVRARIMAVPDGCAGCAEKAVCKGGCRGLAFVEAGPGGRDPCCPGARG